MSEKCRYTRESFQYRKRDGLRSQSVFILIFTGVILFVCQGAPGRSGFPGPSGLPGENGRSNIPGALGDPGYPGLDGDYGNRITSIHCSFASLLFSPSTY